MLCAVRGPSVTAVSRQQRAVQSAAARRMAPAAAMSPQAVSAVGPRALARLRKNVTPLRPEAGGSDAPTEAQEDIHGPMARFFVDNYVKDGMTIGVGTGPTVTAVIEEVGKRLKEGNLKGIKCVSGSRVSTSECAFQGITMDYMSDSPEVSVAVEEASQVDIERADMPFLTWAGELEENKASQPQLVTTRSVLKAAKTKVVVVDSVHKVKDGRLFGSLPVVLSADDEADWEETAEELDDIFIGDADIWRRPSDLSEVGITDPRGGKNPYISSDGTTIVDIKFYGPLRIFGEEKEYEEIVKEITGIPGVVTHGLMLEMADVLLVPNAEGDGVITLDKEDKVLLSDGGDATTNAQ